MSSFFNLEDSKLHSHLDDFEFFNQGEDSSLPNDLLDSALESDSQSDTEEYLYSASGTNFTPHFDRPIGVTPAPSFPFSSYPSHSPLHLPAAATPAPAHFFSPTAAASPSVAQPLQNDLFSLSSLFSASSQSFSRSSVTAFPSLPISHPFAPPVLSSSPSSSAAPPLPDQVLWSFPSTLSPALPFHYAPSPLSPVTAAPNAQSGDSKFSRFWARKTAAPPGFESNTSDEDVPLPLALPPPQFPLSSSLLSTSPPHSTCPAHPIDPHPSSHFADPLPSSTSSSTTTTSSTTTSSTTSPSLSPSTLSSAADLHSESSSPVSSAEPSTPLEKIPIELLPALEDPVPLTIVTPVVDPKQQLTHQTTEQFVAPFAPFVLDIDDFPLLDDPLSLPCDDCPVTQQITAELAAIAPFLLRRSTKVAHAVHDLLDAPSMLVPLRGIALTGPLGAGKSVLAKLVVTALSTTTLSRTRQTLLEHHFPDGIFHLNLDHRQLSSSDDTLLREAQLSFLRFLLHAPSSRCQAPDALAQLAQQVDQLSSLTEGQLLVEQLCQHTRCLVFIDNLHHPELLSLFDHLPTACRFLVTTPSRAVATVAKPNLLFFDAAFDAEEAELFALLTLFASQAQLDSLPLRDRHDATLVLETSLCTGVNDLLRLAFQEEWSLVSLIHRLGTLLQESPVLDDRREIIEKIAQLLFCQPPPPQFIQNFRQFFLAAQNLPILLANMPSVAALAASPMPVAFPDHCLPNIHAYVEAIIVPAAQQLLLSMLPFDRFKLPAALFKLCWAKLGFDALLYETTMQRLTDHLLIYRYVTGQGVFYRLSPLLPLLLTTPRDTIPVSQLLDALYPADDDPLLAENLARADGFYFLAGIYESPAPPPECPVAPEPVEPSSEPVLVNNTYRGIYPASLLKILQSDLLTCKSVQSGHTPVVDALPDDTLSTAVRPLDTVSGVPKVLATRTSELGFYQLCGIYIDLYLTASSPIEVLGELPRAIFCMTPETHFARTWKTYAADLENRFHQLQLAFTTGGAAICFVLGCGWRHLEKAQSYHWFEKAASWHDKCCSFYLACSYLLDQKKNVFLHQLQLTAAQGHPDAAYTLAMAYLKGKYQLVPDEAIAAHWLTVAASLGHGASQYVLGEGHLSGKLGLEQSLDKAISCFVQSAHQHCVEAQFNLARGYELGQGVPQNDVKAAFWYHRAASQGLFAALTKLATLYAEGQGVLPDEATAAAWKAKAAEHLAVGCPPDRPPDAVLVPPLDIVAPTEIERVEPGEVVSPKLPAAPGPPEPLLSGTSFNIHIPEDAHSEFLRGKNYLYGSDGYEKNISEAVNWFRKAAIKGHSDSQFCLAECFSSGNEEATRHAEKSPEYDAIYWYRRAAEQDHSLAQNSLAGAYMHGYGVPRNEKKAIKWYRRASELGLAGAQNNLAYALRHSTDPQIVDEKEASVWFHKAAMQGHAAAQHNLGDAYLLGRGVEKNEAEAVKWYRKAAEQGVAQAQFCLGVAYWLGRGVKQERTESVIRWLLRAKAKGYSAAIDFVNDLKQKNPTESSTAYRFRIQMIREQEKVVQTELLNEKKTELLGEKKLDSTLNVSSPSSPSHTPSSPHKSPSTKPNRGKKPKSKKKR